MSIKLSSFPSVVLFWYFSCSQWRFVKITTTWNDKLVKDFENCFTFNRKRAKTKQLKKE